MLGFVSLQGDSFSHNLVFSSQYRRQKKLFKVNSFEDALRQTLVLFSDEPGEFLTRPIAIFKEP